MKKRILAALLISVMMCLSSMTAFAVENTPQEQGREVKGAEHNAADEAALAQLKANHPEATIAPAAVTWNEAGRLVKLNIYGIGLKGMLDVSGLSALEILNCVQNQLTGLNVNGLTSLKELYCFENQLASLSVSGLSALEILSCDTNKLTSLNVSGLTKLTGLYCDMNLLTSLDVRGLSALEVLSCEGNQLTSLNISGVTTIREVYCADNKLTNLNANNLPALQALYCGNNRLTKLNISGSTELNILWCDNNQLTSLDVRELPYLFDFKYDESTVTLINNDTIMVSGIVLNKGECSLSKGQTVTLSATVSPANAAVKNVEWSTSNSAVATVNSSGKVTAVGAGTAVITAASTDGSNKTATCKITVVQPATGIKLNKTKYALLKGKTYKLSVALTPANSTIKKIKWSTSNSAVATVDGNGKVTAKKKGTAVITATTTDGSNLSATCKITVKQPVTSLKLNKTKYNMTKGATYKLKVTVKPKNADNKAVTWSSSNKKVATVNSSGVVTAKKKGKVTITAKAKDGSKKIVKCEIKVN